MDVLWLTENYLPGRGGMAQSCDRIVSALRDRGLTIHVVHFTNRKKPFHTEKNINGSYTAVPLANDVSHTLNLCLNLLTNPARAFRFDKIAAFGGTLPMSGGEVFSKLFEADLFTFIRGNDFDIPVFDPRKKYNLDKTFEASKAICVNSLDKAHKIKKLYPALNINYTPNGIAVADWIPLKSEKIYAQKWRRENVGDGKKTFGLFGDLKVKKGILFFLESVILSGKKENAHLIFTGDIDPEADDLIEEQDISCSRLPFMDRNDLSKYYEICDWIAIPSFYDGMPNVLLEAGSLGVPILGSDTDGMRDIIHDNQTGLLFHPSDQKACAQKIFKAVSLPVDTIKGFGRALKKVIISDYAIEREAQNYLNIFNGIYDDTAVKRKRATPQ